VKGVEKVGVVAVRERVKPESGEAILSRRPDDLKKEEKAGRGQRGVDMGNNLKATTKTEPYRALKL